MGLFNKILVLGDSHAKVFKRGMLRKGWSFTRFDVVSIGGATAQGAVNPNSKSDALKQYRKKLKKVDASSYSQVLLMLGEVDCGFVIWFYAEKFGQSVEEQLERSINNYREFIKKELLPHLPPERIVLVGAVLPTIKDGTEKQYLNGARAEIDATQQERTALTHEYNRRLAALAEEFGGRYFDVSDAITDPATGMVADDFLNEDPHDHHLSNRRAQPVFLKALTDAIA